MQQVGQGHDKLIFVPKQKKELKRKTKMNFSRLNCIFGPLTI